MKVRGLRGATTAAENTASAIYEATRELMVAMVEQNGLNLDDVASVLLTMTSDLNAAFPAKAVRSLQGWQWVPLMCASELDIQGGLPQCIRVLIHWNTEKAQKELHHVYLGKAVQLRPDLSPV